MEVITMQSEAFKILEEKIDRISDFVLKTAPRNNSETINDIWLDSNEVARLLRISTRTLQRLRTENTINYTMLRGRCLYKLSEIHRCLDEKIIRCDSHTIDDLKRNYDLQVRE